MGAKLTRPEPPVLLFVEDNYDWMYIFRNEFQKTAPHWKITCVPSGEAARDLLASEPAPQALVADLKMPGMDGLELIAWVKEQPQFRFLPIVVLSNSDDPTHRQRSATLGVSSYLGKPASLKELREHIRYIVKLCETSRSFSQEWKEMSCV